MTKEEFKEKWENYWYHHKFGTWVAIIAVLLLIYTGIEYFTSSQNEMIITYLGTYADYEGIATEIENSFSDVIEDIDNDGKKNVYAAGVLTNPQNFEGNAAFWQSVKMNFANGESYIYFVDERIYGILKDRDVIDLIQTKDGAVEFIDVSENEYFKKYKAKDQKLYICVRKEFGTNATKKIKLMENNSKKVLEKILENN